MHPHRLPQDENPVYSCCFVCVCIYIYTCDLTSVGMCLCVIIRVYGFASYDVAVECCEDECDASA